MSQENVEAMGDSALMAACSETMKLIALPLALMAAALTASACGGSDDNVADFTPEKSEAPPQHAAEKKPFGFDFLEQEGG